MQSENQESVLSISKQWIIILIISCLVFSLLIFKNHFFKSSLLLKNFGESSVDPEIAFKNNKPTFLEFYADWCEVCREMAPKVALMREEYENEINFVFLNVDNPKWENYIKKFDVSGIPQVNLFDRQANLEDTFLGKQEEEIIKKSLENLVNNVGTESKILSSEFSLIKENKKNQYSPRSHG